MEVDLSAKSKSHGTLPRVARPAVFLDRDGTLIVDKEYLYRPEEVELLPGVVEGLAQLRGAGFACVVVTNQSGIGRGYFREADMHRVHIEMLRRFHACGVDVDGIYFSPHTPTSADRSVVEHADRKPGPGMLLRAARDLGLDLARSWMVGDAISDLLAGRNAGCRQSVLVLTGKSAPADLDLLRRDWPVHDSFTSAVRHITSTPGPRR
jgi:D-glycero-D-manno-heptose 1,7-bisphosphate phosphatase